jgi:hypothetical protein
VGHIAHTVTTVSQTGVAPQPRLGDAPAGEAVPAAASPRRYAYIGASGDWRHPVDRRRFPRYCKLAGIPLEPMNWRAWPDVLVVTQSADLTYCSRIPRSDCRIVFDANDGYLIPKKWDVRDPARGFFKFVTRQHRYPELDYERTYLRMCERADAVVCSHPLQAAIVKEHCDNVHLITDFGPEVELGRKRDYSMGDPINVFWEGIGSTRYMPFTEINRIFGAHPKRSSFRFHLFTDLEIRGVADRFFRTTAMEECRKKAPDLAPQFYFYQWNEQMFPVVATACDFAVIPIPLDNTFGMYKPENKLVLMWRMGIPTIVSATPSYADAMSRVECDLACADDAQWTAAIDRVLGSEALRRAAGDEGYREAGINYGDSVLRARWERVLASIA